MAESVERTSFRHTAASVALDAVRGMAALLVMFDHCHNLFFVNLDTALQASRFRLLTYGLYAFSSTGAEVVVIFFVLSGYLISGSVFRSMEQGRWSWKDYLTHRVVRLGLVLVPALVLCAAWDCGRLAMTVPADGSAAAGAAVGFTARMAAAGITWKIFFGNVFFLQTIRTNTFGSDRVLWSLAAEFWYYILFPMGLLALRPGLSRPGLLRTRVLYGVGFVLVGIFITRGVFDLFPVWLCGTALAMVKAPKVGAGMRWLAGVVYVPIVFGLAMTPWPWHIFKMDYLLGMLTAIFLWVMLSDHRRVDDKALTVRVVRTVAAFSYSLYLVHYPFLFFWANWFNHGVGWLPTARTLGIGAVCCAMAVVYGYGVAYFTEFRNERVRLWVEAKLNRAPRARIATAVR